MDLFKKFVGGQGRPAQSPLPPVEDDFADFAGAPDPSPAVLTPSAAAAISQTLTESAVPTSNALPISRPYTKWYRVWERTSVSDFYAEFFIIPLILVLLFVHLWGSRRNRKKASSWLKTHGPILKQEFASVGFSGRESPDVKFETVSGAVPNDVLREKALNEYITYASGRQNVAFVDIKLTMKKRYNPSSRIAEEIVGFFFESIAVSQERMEATSYVFDGKETELVALLQGPEGAAQGKKEKFNSSYDGFVWAVVHKDAMQKLRDSRYDLSLTTTKDHAKLPTWATVMSESAEITDSLLTPQLIEAINQAGEALETLIITDQPIDKPTKIDEAIPKKRVSLSIKLPAGSDVASFEPTIPIFSYFVRLPDLLTSTAHFRPEVLRRVRATREDEIRKIKKLDETEKAEERRVRVEKDKKKERDDKLRNLNADEQRKFLEKERAQEMRKSTKSKTMRG